MQVISTCSKCKHRWSWDTDEYYPPPLCPSCGFDTIWAGRRNIERPVRPGSEMHLRSADQSAPTPLDRAVIAGNVDAVRSLIREGGDVVNGSPDDGETPLHLLMGSSAVKSEANRLAVAQLLLDAGADRLARTWWNEIPYDLAIFYNREAKLIALVDPDAPAPIAIKCPQCGREGRVPADQAGVYLRCKCGHTFQVPAPGKPAEAGADHASQAKAWRDQARAQGKTDEEIRAAMRQAGWGQEEIEALLSEPGP